jgi:hypothetical protein
VNIDSLTEKHKLELEKEKAEHKNKLEIIELEHNNEIARKTQELETSTKYSAIGDIISNLDKINEIIKAIENPAFMKYARK